MGHSDVNIAALIGSRICHDLISPIGAINNGIELLGMSGTNDGPEMELISESVGNASARIRFFRIAYGAASDQPVGRAEVISILQDNMRGGRITVDYAPADAQPRWAIRIVFLAIQCLETALPYGGDISVRHEAGTWHVTGRSEKLSIDADLWSWIRTGRGATLTPPHVQFGLIPEVARDAGRKMRLEQDVPGAVTVSF